MNCGDMRGRLDPYLDGELGMEENVEVVRHLESCAPCASAVEGERLFFDEVRRQASGPPAPASLRTRIAAGISASKPASRPWPFLRALVPAAAAAVLVAGFVTFFAPQQVEADTIAGRAVAWHERPRMNAASVSGVPEIISFFGDRGQKSCTHERTVGSGLKYQYQTACVDNAGPAGTVTCWWTAACPDSGTRMSHARFPVPAGSVKSLLEKAKQPIPVGSRVVVLNYREGFV